MVDYREKLKILQLASDADNGNGVKVAVIDTGVPDIYGVPVSLAENFTLGSAHDTGHATFIGSILFGISKNLHGICPKATSCFCKVFNGRTATPETVAAAIDYATDIWGVDIINVSLGFSGSIPCNNRLKKSCEAAIKKGVLIVASAGNTGEKNVFWPAALPGVICVGSSNGKYKDSFSNSGNVDVVAPGAEVSGLDTKGCITTNSGTSFSTAIITGLLTLLLARRRKSEKCTIARDVKQELIDLCVDINTKGWDMDTGFGFPFPKLAYKTFMQRVGLSAYSVFVIIKNTIRKVIASLKTKEDKKHE